MSKSPSIQMYLLDIVARAQIAAAEKTGDSKKIADAHNKYDNLTEEEVTFGKAVQNAQTKKYEVSIASKARGWELKKVSYNTGTLQGLIKNVLQGYAKLDSLDKVPHPLVAYVDESNAYYLVVEKDSNIYDAIQLTGYTFPAETLQTNMYPEVDHDNRAVGFVDVNHSIVTGRFLINYINRGEYSNSGEQHNEDLGLHIESDEEQDNTDADQQQSGAMTYAEGERIAEERRNDPDYPKNVDLNRQNEVNDPAAPASDPAANSDGSVSDDEVFQNTKPADVVSGSEVENPGTVSHAEVFQNTSEEQNPSTPNEDQDQTETENGQVLSQNSDETQVSSDTDESHQTTEDGVTNHDDGGITNADDGGITNKDEGGVTNKDSDDGVTNADDTTQQSVEEGDQQAVEQNDETVSEHDDSQQTDTSEEEEITEENTAPDEDMFKSKK